jgi:hypothetical protein
MVAQWPYNKTYGMRGVIISVVSRNGPRGRGVDLLNPHGKCLERQTPLRLSVPTRPSAAVVPRCVRLAVLSRVRRLPGNELIEEALLADGCVVLI